MLQPRTPLGLAAAALGVLALAAPPARGENVTYTLQDLLQGQAFRSGPLTFTNFSNFYFLSYGGKVVDPTRAYFSPLSGDGRFGFTLTQDGAFQLPQGQTVRAHVEFDVRAAAPGAMTGASLDLAPPEGSGIITVQESLTNLKQTFLVSNVAGIPSNHLDFPVPVSVVHVAEDIVITPRGEGLSLGEVRAEFATQGRHEELSAEAPEPSTLALLALGAAGLIGSCRRRRTRRAGGPAHGAAR